MRCFACAFFLPAGLLCSLRAPAQKAPAGTPNVSAVIDPGHPVHFDVNLIEVDAIVTDSHG